MAVVAEWLASHHGCSKSWENWFLAAINCILRWRFLVIFYVYVYIYLFFHFFSYLEGMSHEGGCCNWFIWRNRSGSSIGEGFLWHFHTLGPYSISSLVLICMTVFWRKDFWHVFINCCWGLSATPNFIWIGFTWGIYSDELMLFFFCRIVIHVGRVPSPAVAISTLI